MTSGGYVNISYWFYISKDFCIKMTQRAFEVASDSIYLPITLCPVWNIMTAPHELSPKYGLFSPYSRHMVVEDNLKDLPLLLGPKPWQVGNVHSSIQEALNGS